MKRTYCLTAVMALAIVSCGLALADQTETYQTTYQDENRKLVKAKVEVTAVGKVAVGKFWPETGGLGILAYLQQGAQEVSGTWAYGTKTGRFRLKSVDQWKTFTGTYYVDGEIPPVGRAWWGSKIAPSTVQDKIPGSSPENSATQSGEKPPGR